jgi:SAM-dependent methyltransferase
MRPWAPPGLRLSAALRWLRTGARAASGAEDAMPTYVYDQAWQGERERLLALEDLFDAASVGRLAALGVGDGWRCLEVGCGAGGVARWLAERVGARGRVLATDLDPRFLEGHGLGNLEVRRHDILSDPLEEVAFDLAHARAVLEHLPAREQALARMVAAVRPGGWVVVEDIDFGGGMVAQLGRYVRPPDAAPLVERVARAVEALFAAVGIDPGFGARLPGALLEAGLEAVGAELRAPMAQGGGERDFIGLSVAHLRPRLVGAGLLADADIDRLLALTADPGFRYMPLPMVTAWGRRPTV